MALLSAYGMPSCDKAGVLQVEPAALGPFVHEFSHGFGLPDLYDLNVPPLGGVGKFSNMASSQVKEDAIRSRVVVNCSSYCLTLIDRRDGTFHRLLPGIWTGGLGRK